MSKPEWTQVPAERSSLPLLKIKFWTVVAAWLVGPPVAALLVVVAMTQSEPVEVTPESVQPEARAFAEVVAWDYLSGDTLQVPTVEGVSRHWGAPSFEPMGVSRVAWDGFSEHTGFLPGQVFEQHRFLVVAGTEADTELFELSVPVVLTASGPLLGAYPSLTPQLSAPSSAGDALDWDELSQYDVPAPLRQRVEDWAAAYATDDRRALKTLTGDDRLGVTYVGVRSFKASNVSVRSAVLDGTGEYVFVRVRVQLERANGFKTSSDFDLLISAHGTDLPTVQAWGPAGMAPSLQPYQNAVQTSNPSQEETTP